MHVRQGEKGNEQAKETPTWFCSHGRIVSHAEQLASSLKPHDETPRREDAEGTMSVELRLSLSKGAGRTFQSCLIFGR